MKKNGIFIKAIMMYEVLGKSCGNTSHGKNPLP